MIPLGKKSLRMERVDFRSTANREVEARGTKGTKLSQH